MRFEEACGGRQSRRLTEKEAVRLPGGQAHGLPPRKRGFRRYVDSYEDEGLDGLADKRLGQVPARRAPVDEAVRTEAVPDEPRPALYDPA